MVRVCTGHVCYVQYGVHVPCVEKKFPGAVANEETKIGGIAVLRESASIEVERLACFWGWISAVYVC